MIGSLKNFQSKLPRYDQAVCERLIRRFSWQQAVYHMDDPTWILHPPINKGHEAMAYLTFIIAHYDILPSIMVFIHPRRRDWHNDAKDSDNVNSLRNLQIGYVQRHGYANLRCSHIPGCPDEIKPFRNDSTRIFEVPFADAYTDLFGGDYSTVPQTVGVTCCAQFAVSKAQVRARPKSDYLRYRRWLMETDLHDEISGRVFEYLWHIIFGKPPVWCPDEKTCRCELFGRCDTVDYMPWG